MNRVKKENEVRVTRKLVPTLEVIEGQSYTFIRLWILGSCSLQVGYKYATSLGLRWKRSGWFKTHRHHKALQGVYTKRCARFRPRILVTLTHEVSFKKKDSNIAMITMDLFVIWELFRDVEVVMDLESGTAGFCAVYSSRGQIFFSIPSFDIFSICFVIPEWIFVALSEVAYSFQMRSRLPRVGCCGCCCCCVF